MCSLYYDDSLKKKSEEEKNEREREEEQEAWERVRTAGYEI